MIRASELVQYLSLPGCSRTHAAAHQTAGPNELMCLALECANQRIAPPAARVQRHQSNESDEQRVYSFTEVGLHPLTAVPTNTSK